MVWYPASTAWRKRRSVRGMRIPVPAFAGLMRHEPNAGQVSVALDLADEPHPEKQSQSRTLNLSNVELRTPILNVSHHNKKRGGYPAVWRGRSRPHLAAFFQFLRF